MNENNSKILILMDMPLFPYRIYAYNELAERGYKLTVVSVENGKTSYPVKQRFEHIPLKKKEFGGFVKISGLSAVEYDEYDVIVMALDLRYIDYLSLLFSKYRRKVIAWGHMKGHTAGNPLAQRLRIRFARQLPAIIFYDYVTRDEYLEAGFPKDKLFVANNTQYVDPSTVRLDKERHYFLYVGRIQERKGLELALKSFAKALYESANNTVSFKIVGGGDYVMLKSLANSLGIKEKVDFVGPVHDEDKLGELFSGALAYVSPGHVGLGVLHSFAFGVPVITCKDRKHSVEFANCNTDNSYLPGYTVEEVADVMKEVLVNEEERKLKSQNAYNYYNQYCTIDKMVDGIDNAIRYTIGHK